MTLVGRGLRAALMVRAVVVVVPIAAPSRSLSSPRARPAGVVRADDYRAARSSRQRTI